MAHRFEQVVADHKDRVYSFALYYLGDPQEAEDVTQEVFLKLWRSWEDGRTIDSTPRWLHRVTRNACFDALRRRKVRRGVLEPMQEWTADTTPAEDPDPAEELSTAELQRKLRRLLAELPEPYRSVLLLRELLELKYQEISETLDLPLNTVKAQIFRGRRMLREKLTADAGAVVHAAPEL